MTEAVTDTVSAIVIGSATATVTGQAQGQAAPVTPAAQRGPAPAPRTATAATRPKRARPAAGADAAVAQAQAPRAITDGGATDAQEQEPNNTPAQATALTLPAKVTGRIYGTDGADTDLYRFTARAGEQWVLEINAARSKSPLDSKLEVLSADGAPIERVRLQAMRDSWLTFRGKDSNTSGDFRLFKWDEMMVEKFLNNFTNDNRKQSLSFLWFYSTHYNYYFPESFGKFEPYIKRHYQISVSYTHLTLPTKA